LSADSIAVILSASFGGCQEFACEFGWTAVIGSETIAASLLGVIEKTVITANENITPIITIVFMPLNCPEYVHTLLLNNNFVDHLNLKNSNFSKFNLRSLT
jgi:hypothetical protein